MMKLQKKYVGQIFGKLKILDQIPGKKSICLCECGKTKTIRTNSILKGYTKSCGCISSINRKNYDEDMKEKFLSSVEIKENGCWEWKYSKHRQGYGNFPYKRGVLLAHRASWLFFKGDIPRDILVCHHCDNPPCCNPDHLFLGTDRDNVIDGFKKKRIPRHSGEQNVLSKLKTVDVIEIRKLAKKGIRQIDIAKRFNITFGHVGVIVRRKAWKHV